MSMKNLVYTFTAVLAIVAITACDNGNADFDIIDVAPSITFGDIGTFFDNRAATIPITVKDGNPGFAQSTIASVTFVVTDSDGNEVNSGTAQASGNLAETTVDFTAGALAPGDYTVLVTARDSSGNSATVEATFSMFKGFNSIGIIGSATAGGWGADTDMTETSDGVYEVTIALTAMAAKFRADDDWAVNWGAADFPSGSGTQDGADIPVAEAGTYLVTFDTKDGSYNFEKQ